MRNCLFIIALTFFAWPAVAWSQELRSSTLPIGKTYANDIDPLNDWYEELFENTALVNELELTDSQVDALRQGLKKQGMSWIRRKKPNVIVPSTPYIITLQRRQAEEAKAILLPHQIEELEQLAFHDAQRQMGTTGLLSMKWFRDRIGISEDQLVRIQEWAAKEKAKLEETIAKARKEAEENVLDELTPEQKKKIKELLGDENE